MMSKDPAGLGTQHCIWSYRLEERTPELILNKKNIKQIITLSNTMTVKIEETGIGHKKKIIILFQKF